MADLIDRQAAIAHAISGRVRTLPTSEDGENWIRTEEVRQSLLTMPSAQQWIPCSEKPITSGLYIVTLEDEKGLFTDTAEWNPTFGGRWQSVFYDDDAIGEYRDISNVIAWQPLPDPYKGGEQG